MKALTAICIFLFSLALNAQTPDYFGNNPEWRQSSSCGIPYPCVENQEYVYYINGDSLVEDIVWKKLFKHGQGYFQLFEQSEDPEYCVGSWTFDEFHVLLRQEENRIYIKTVSDETLLYDFDLEVGDALPLTWNQWNEGITITSIEELQVGAETRKVFNLSGDSSPQLMEGIGHEFGFLEPFPTIFDCGHNLYCYASDGITYFPGPDAECDFTVDVQTINKEIQIESYPNPVVDLMTIEYPNNISINKVNVYNTLGQKQHVSFQINGDGQLSLDFSNVNSGIYIVRIQSDGSHTQSLRVLKE